MKTLVMKKIKFTELNDNITVFDSIKTGEFLENPYEDYAVVPDDMVLEIMEKYPFT